MWSRPVPTVIPSEATVLPSQVAQNPSETRFLKISALGSSVNKGQWRPPTPYTLMRKPSKGSTRVPLVLKEAMRCVTEAAGRRLSAARSPAADPL